MAPLNHPSTPTPGALGTPLKVGDAAPGFDVPACTGDHKHRVTLAEFRGKKNVVLAYYPADWTPA